MNVLYEEDKTCRICATANSENFNIFYGKDRHLHDKILSVYPMIIYKDDPLPKNICSRCAGYVNALYSNMQKILKTQKKWIDNVRTNQPENNFVKVLDIIERNHRETVREVMEVTNSEFIMPPSLEPPRMLKLNIDNPNQKSFTYFDTDCLNNEQITESKFTISNMLPPCPRSKRPTQNELALPILTTNEITIQPCKKTKVSIPTMQKIQSLLESNGCTLYTVGSSKQQLNKSPSNKSTLESLLFSPLKSEPIQNMPIKKKFDCAYCPFKSFELNDIAIHGLTHLRLPIYKIFERKYLPKVSRKGRLITIHNRKCMRCLNCWRVFLDNKAILEHWEKGKCDFYCQICNKEYRQSPKMLREHVPAAHGISFRSSKRREDYSPSLTIGKIEKAELIQNKGDKFPPTPDLLKSKLFTWVQKDKPEEKVFCEICKKVFSTSKGRNSHMRAHKPPSLFSSNQIDNNCIEKCSLVAIKKEPTDHYDDGIRTNFPNRTATITSKSSETDTIIRTLGQNQPILKVKSLSELQDPCVSSQLSEDEPHSSKKFSNVDHMNYEKTFNCIPCRENFQSKLELFRHKRKCEANNLIVCQFCTKGFTSSTDLQLHIVLTHKN